jgi:hypothetical protein
MRKLIISLPLLATLLTTTTTTATVAPLVGVQHEAYAQGVAFYDSVNEQQQGLISQVLSNLLSQTAEPRLSIFEDPPNMIITWTETIPVTAPDGRVFEIEQDSSLTVPHNFTIENGYTYRDGTIFKPDGTELFAE